MNGIDYDTRPMPGISELCVLDKCRIEVLWARGEHSGQREIVDLSPVVEKYRIYAPIRGGEAFAKVTLDDDGETLVWDDDIDMPATMVEDLAREQMTGHDFQAFLERNALTRREAAAELGRSLRAIQHYVARKGPVPRTVMLACHGYESKRKS
jgi:hypothetical protein